MGTLIAEVDQEAAPPLADADRGRAADPGRTAVRRQSGRGWVSV